MSEFWAEFLSIALIQPKAGPLSSGTLFLGIFLIPGKICRAISQSVFIPNDFSGGALG